MARLYDDVCAATFAALILLIFLETTCGHPGDSIDPSHLARELRAEICATNSTQIKEFYKEMREKEGRNISFPDPSVNNEYQYPERMNAGAESVLTISWYTPEVYKAIRPFVSKLTLESFTWCIRLLSTSDEHYGCINASTHWSTPSFEALGFFDIMTLEDGRYSLSKGKLTLDVSNVHYLTVLKGALISCTILLPDGSTVGVYFAMHIIFNEAYSEFVSISKQKDAFLIQGQQKTFSCSSFALTQFSDYKWYMNGTRVEVIYQNYLLECLSTNPGGNESCLNYQVFQYNFVKSEDDCKHFSIDSGIVTNVLVFLQSSPNDTGRYVCSNGVDALERSIYIAVVFIIVPPKRSVFKKDSHVLVVCSMKAPTDSVVYWTLKHGLRQECRIPFLNDSMLSPTGLKICNTSAIAKETRQSVDDTFSLFHLELELLKATSDHHGEYVCSVEYYSTPTETQLIQQTTTIFINSSLDETVDVKASKSLQLSESQLVGVVVGSFFFCLLIGATVTASLILWVGHIKRTKHKRRMGIRLPFSRHNHQVYDRPSVDSGLEKFKDFEFPRTQLELQEVLGEGRFGKVYKGKAHGIVPHLPNLSTVAVKTATSMDKLHSCTQQLLSELEIMTKIQPHENICNLLASCTSPDGPLYVIMEYASHGNLKDYLERCRMALQQRNIPLHVGTEEESSILQLKGSDQPKINNCSRHSTVEASVNTSGIVHIRTHAPVPLNFNKTSTSSHDDAMPGKIDLESGVNAKVAERDEAPLSPTSPTGYSRLVSVSGAAASCGLITELNVCDFAHQIASGLQHLENLNIVHCDLAARNILIAENFLLKIGDFGLATMCDLRYLSNTDMESTIAMKWAAPEFLEQHTFSFKSDIWSFATVLWEIATYGDKPFVDFTIGASLEPFIQHLKDGNKLPQPEGLSDSIYEELCNCWSVDPGTRPDITSLIDYFEYHALSQDPHSSVKFKL